MLFVFPDYYKNFKCIASSCRHNCCIGWEIDIDADTAAFYETVPDELGKRLCKNISHEGDTHFILTKDERCPFLNCDNLCYIILTLGEEALCDICTEHPRFRNELPGRIETGLGLCCEEAARLILGKATPMTLEISGYGDTQDEIIRKRDEIISILQNRTESISERITEMLSLCNSKPLREVYHYVPLLMSLERMDSQWEDVLEKISQPQPQPIKDAFALYMQGRETEYEQLLVYFIYRHFANASDDEGMAERAAFAAFAYETIYAAGMALFAENGELSFETQVGLARLFSSEIEYSDENRDIILSSL